MLSGFFIGQNWLLSGLYHLVNHQNTQVNADTKFQAENRHIFRVLDRFYRLIFGGYPCILSMY